MITHPPLRGTQLLESRLVLSSFSLAYGFQTPVPGVPVFSQSCVKGLPRRGGRVQQSTELLHPYLPRDSHLSYGLLEILSDQMGYREE